VAPQIFLVGLLAHLCFIRNERLLKVPYRKMHPRRLLDCLRKNFSFCLVLGGNGRFEGLWFERGQQFLHGVVFYDCCHNS